MRVACYSCGASVALCCQKKMFVHAFMRLWRLAKWLCRRFIVVCLLFSLAALLIYVTDFAIIA